jgi:hypothetical protein
MAFATPQRIGTLIVPLVVLLISIVVVEAAESFPVYRVVQYSSQGVALGCHRASLNLLASSPVSSGVVDSDVARKVAVLSYKVRVALC